MMNKLTHRPTNIASWVSINNQKPLMAICLLVCGVIMPLLACNSTIKNNSIQAAYVSTDSFIANQPIAGKLFSDNETVCFGTGLEDETGNLWFGSNGQGLYKYDGHTFVQYTIKDHLNSNIICCLAQDKNGILWIGTSKGLNCFDGKKFINVPIIINKPIWNNTKTNFGQPPAENRVWSLMIDSKETMWIGSDAGVYCYSQSAFSSFLDRPELVNKDSLSLKSIFSILETKNGAIWFAACAAEGISKFENNQLINMIPYKQVGRTDRLLEDQEGTIWLDCVFKGISQYKNNRFTQNIFKTDPKTGPCNIVADFSGNIYFDTPNGLAKYDGKKIKLYNEQDGATAKNMIPILVQKTGELWLSSPGLHLFQLHNGKFTSF